MSRHGIPGMTSPHSLIEALPALYQEDGFAARLTEAFDEILAPAISTIDNVTAYLDPALTPDDFLDWLAGWVGALLDETWPIERRRAFVARAAEIYRRRGTAAGLADHIRIFTSGEVEITESGAAAWSPKSGSRMPGAPDFTIHVVVKPPRGAPIDPKKLDELVGAAKPAHVRHTVEVAKQTAASSSA